MSLTELAVTRRDAYFAGGVFGGVADNEWDNDGLPPNDGPSEFYYNRLDRIYSFKRNSTGVIFVDPLMLSNVAPAAGVIVNAAIPVSAFALGEWDRVANTQRIYGADPDGVDQDVKELSITTFDIIDDLPFPNVGFDETKNGKTSTQDGWYGSGVGSLHFFETIGKAYHPAASVREGGVTHTNVFIEIDLVTGDAVRFGVPTEYVQSPGVNAAPEFAGDQFQLRYLQYIPDDDDTPGQPKGFFMLTTLRENDLSSSGDGTPGTVRVYVKFVEFNPTGKSPAPGTPNRVHKRETLLSRFFLVEETEPESGGIGVADGSNTKLYNGEPAIFHPPSRTIRMHFNSRNVGGPSDRVEVVHSIAPFVDQLTPPTALSTVATASVVKFATNALGDLGERIGSVNLQWSLERVSTLDEPLNTIGAPATSTVANPPIDAGSLVVERLGVSLVETTDYTVVLSTGVITWLGSHPDLDTGYTASYRHTGTPATPPHGTLRTEFSQTDGSGEAITSIEYPDNSALVGELDKLTATEI